MTHQPDDLDRRAAQEAAQERGQRRPPYIGARVRILYRCDGIDLLRQEADDMRRAGYEGVVTKQWEHEANGKDEWRVDFANNYLYLAEDEFEVLE